MTVTGFDLAQNQPNRNRHVLPITLLIMAAVTTEIGMF
jgi:hypothetical protein